MEKNDNYQRITEAVVNMFTRDMPFIKSFQFELLELSETHTMVKFAMQPEFIGNTVQQILHGGVAATALDSIGGMLAMLARCAKDKEASLEEQIRKISKAATIDLRIDYLRPGRGKFFLVQVEVIRCGNRITVVDSKLVNEEGVVIAIGRGTYVVGH